MFPILLQLYSFVFFSISFPLVIVISFFNLTAFTLEHDLYNEVKIVAHIYIVFFINFTTIHKLNKKKKINYKNKKDKNFQKLRNCLTIKKALIFENLIFDC